MEGAVYLDHNATTPVKPEVRTAIGDALAACGNPSSVHRYGRLARRRIEEARERVAASVGVTPEAVIFTSGGTEANALALVLGGGRSLLIGATEHDSILKAAPGATRIPVGADGVVDPARLQDLLAAMSGPAVVLIQLANNETGVIQPIVKLAEVVHAMGGCLHVDAAQALGRIPVDAVRLGADTMALSAHKMGGPQGVGALIIRADLAPAPIIRGGGQERGWRAGTENLPGIVGFGVAVELAKADLDRAAEIAEWRDTMERRILDFAPEARVHGRGVPRLPNTSCLGMPGVDSQTQVMGFDLAGIAVSAGAACSSGKLRRSRVLEAMGVPAEDADCAIRVSLGWTTSAADLNRFCEAWSVLYLRVARKAGTEGKRGRWRRSLLTAKAPTA